MLIRYSEGGQGTGVPAGESVGLAARGASRDGFIASVSAKVIVVFLSGVCLPSSIITRTKNGLLAGGGGTQNLGDAMSLSASARSSIGV